MRRGFDDRTGAPGPSRGRSAAGVVPVGEADGAALADAGAAPALGDDERLGLFVDLCETMLDVSGLAASTAKAFLKIVVDAAPATYGVTDGPRSPVDVVLLTFERLRRQSPDDLERRTANVLYADMTLGPILKNMLIVWYNGGLGAVVGPIDAYADALVWKAISAHPPGLPGPYYGSWAYPPAQPIVAPDAGAEP